MACPGQWTHGRFNLQSGGLILTHAHILVHRQGRKWIKSRLRVPTGIPKYLFGCTGFPLVYAGFPWCPLVSPGFPWFPLVSPGFFWFPLVYSGFAWFPLVSPGFPWFPLLFAWTHWAGIQVELQQKANSLLTGLQGEAGGRRLWASKVHAKRPRRAPPNLQAVFSLLLSFTFQHVLMFGWIFHLQFVANMRFVFQPANEKGN